MTRTHTHTHTHDTVGRSVSIIVVLIYLMMMIEGEDKYVCSYTTDLCSRQSYCETVREHETFSSSLPSSYSW